MGILFPKNTHSKITYSKSRMVKGRPTTPTATTETLIADIQPITGRELDTLEIGSRELGKIKIYSDTELFIRDETNNKAGDIITWDADSQNYEVIGKLEYNNNLINHIKYIAELRKNDNAIGSV